MKSWLSRAMTRPAPPALGRSYQRRHLTLQGARAGRLLEENGISIHERSEDHFARNAKLWYLAVAIDRSNCTPKLLLVKSTNRKQVLPAVHPTAPYFSATRLGTETSLRYDQQSDLAAQIQFPPMFPDLMKPKLAELASSLLKIFKEKDATLVEISELWVSPYPGERQLDESNGGDPNLQQLRPLSARVIIDDAAASRQKNLFAQRETEKEDWREVEAEKFGLVYKRMEGTIGTVVNGAGLAMATCDAIAQYGGKSANFLDAGGQATKETMIEALRLVLSDERVKSIMVNVYGGITKCDMIAQSIIGAAQELEIKVPVVVRLQGTNSEEGLKLLEEADLGMHVEAGFGEAAQKAVALAGGGEDTTFAELLLSAID